MPADRTDLLHGTLELLVLRVLTVEPMHGWGVAQRLEQMSGDVLSVDRGSLYPALQRMKRKGCIRSEWWRRDKNRRARYYLLTRTGERQLAEARAAWERASAAVNGVLDWSGSFA